MITRKLLYATKILERKLKSKLRMKKRGISPVIATLALVLLTITAVTIISGIIVPLVRNNLAATDCFAYRNYFYFEEEGYNCYSFDGNNYLYGMSVGAQSSKKELTDNIKGFKLIFLKEGEAESVDIFEGNDASSSSGGIRMLNSSVSKIVIPDIGEVRTYIYHAEQNNFNSVEVIPILKDGKICESSDSIHVRNSLCNSLDMDTAS